jgi:hypothetical protein
MAVSEINFAMDSVEFQLTSLDVAALLVSLRRWCGTEKKKDYNFKVLIECHNFWLQLIQFVISDFGNIF